MKKRLSLFNTALMIIMVLSIFFGILYAIAFILVLIFEGKWGDEGLFRAVVLLGIGMGLSLTVQIKEALCDPQKDVWIKTEDGD